MKVEHSSTFMGGVGMVSTPVPSDRSMPSTSAKRASGIGPSKLRRLWATTTCSCNLAARVPAISARRGAPVTKASSMPWMWALGMGCPGCTRVSHSSVILPSGLSRTRATSTIRQPGHRWSLRPHQPPQLEPGDAPEQKLLGDPLSLLPAVQGMGLTVFEVAAVDGQAADAG